MPEASVIDSDVSRPRRWVRAWQIIVVLFVATYYKDLRRRLAQDFQYRMGVWPRNHIFTDDLFGSIYLICQCWAWQLWSALVGALISIIAICVATRTPYLIPAVVALVCAWLPHALIWGIMLYYVFVVRLEIKLAWEAGQLETQIRRLEHRLATRQIRERRARFLTGLAGLDRESVLQQLEEGSMSDARFDGYRQEVAPYVAQSEQATGDSHISDLAVRPG